MFGQFFRMGFAVRCIGELAVRMKRQPQPVCVVCELTFIAFIQFGGGEPGGIVRIVKEGVERNLHAVFLVQSAQVCQMKGIEDGFVLFAHKFRQEEHVVVNEKVVPFPGVQVADEPADDGIDAIADRDGIEGSLHRNRDGKSAVRRCNRACSVVQRDRSAGQRSAGKESLFRDHQFPFNGGCNNKLIHVLPILC